MIERTKEKSRLSRDEDKEESPAVENRALVDLFNEAQYVGRREPMVRRYTETDDAAGIKATADGAGDPKA